MKQFKSYVTFNNIIYLVVLSFIMYHLFSLYSIDLIYVSTNYSSPIIYIATSALLIALIIVFIYYLPILFVVEVVYNLNVDFQYKIVLIPRIIKKRIISPKTYELNNLFQLLPVMRC